MQPDPTLPSPTQHPGQAGYRCPSCGCVDAHSEFCPGFEENDPAVRVARVRDAAALAEARAALDERREERDDAHTEIGELTAANAALLADLDAAREALREAQSTVADLLHKRDAWQRRTEEATLRNADLAAERDRMRPVVEAAKAWRRADGRGPRLAAAVDTYEKTQESTDGD